MIRVIRFENKYFEQVYSIHAESFEDEKMSKVMFLQEIKAGARSYFVAVDDDESVLGYAGAWNTGDDYSVISIATKKEKRNTGIATELLKRLIIEARQTKISAISLEVNEKNYPAIELYRKFGFIITNVRKAYYKNKQSAYIMWLYL